MWRLRSRTAAAAAVIAASAASLADVAYADSGYSFFRRSSPPPPPPAAAAAAAASEDSGTEVAVEVDSSGFDPESLERAARLLRKLNSSKYAKQARCLLF